MADTNWMDRYRIEEPGVVKSTPKGAIKHGSPVPLDTDTQDWMSKYRVEPTPSVATKSKQQIKLKSPVIGQKADDILTSVFGPINKFMRGLPLGLDPMEKKIMPSVMKGVPIAGQMVPQTEDLTQFEENNPTASTLLKGTGAIASTVHMAAGVAARSAAGWIPQAFNQGMLGGTLGVGDLLAAKGSDLEEGDIESAMGTGFAGGFGGSTLGRMITPTVPSRAVLGKVGRRGKPEPNLSRQDIEFRAHRSDPGVERSRQMLDAVLKKQPAAPINPSPRQTTAEQITSALLRTGIGGALSHTMGMGPIPGMVVGAASPFIPGMAEKGAKAWYRNQLLNKPRGGMHFAEKYFPSDKPSQLPRYILNALMMQGGQQ